MKKNFSFTNWCKYQKAKLMSRVAFFTCEENRTTNQEPHIMFFTCEHSQDDFHSYLTGSVARLRPFAKLYNFVVQPVFKVEFI